MRMLLPTRRFRPHELIVPRRSEPLPASWSCTGVIRWLPVHEELDWSAYADDVPSRPGVVVAVVVRDEIAEWKSFGSTRPDGPPLDPDSVLYVGSIAKQFTASAIASLIIDGVLDLDAPIRTIVPQLPAALDPIRIVDLLTHTSGLPDSNAIDAQVGFTAESTVTNADRIAGLGDAQLRPTPGEVRAYSNLGFVLLAEAITTITGERFGDYVRSHLLESAGMHSTGFLDVKHPTPVDGCSEEGPVTLRFTTVGDGGLVSTVTDLARWNRWLPESPLADFVLGHRPTLADGRVAHDAWGVSIRSHHGLRIESHGGSFTGYTSSFVRFPDHDRAFIALSNTDQIPPQDFSRRLRIVADSTLGEALDRRKPPWTDTHGDPLPDR